MSYEAAANAPFYMYILCPYTAHACTLAVVTCAASGGAVLGVCMGHSAKWGKKGYAALWSAYHGGTGMQPCMLMPLDGVRQQDHGTHPAGLQPLVRAYCTA